MSSIQRGNLFSAGLGIVFLIVSITFFCQRCAFDRPASADGESTQTIAAKITCPDIEFAGDVGFVTSREALHFRCETIDPIEIPEGYRDALPKYEWSASSGVVNPQGMRCTWKTLAPGLQTIQVTGTVKLEPKEKGSWFSSAPESKTVTFSTSMTCMAPKHVPVILEGMIDGYRIGEYPDPNDPEVMKQVASLTARRIKAYPESYTPPTLFYPVTPDTFFVKIFKDYRLGDFDIDPRFMKLDYPRYIYIHPNLLRKLELLKSIMNDAGQPVSKFKFIYAFRSPHYNLGARDEDGNKTLKMEFSSHMYGRAVDMIVDENDDLVIDDLNQDGTIDYKDAKKLLAYVDMLDDVLKDDPKRRGMVGGAGWYYHNDFYERGEYAQTPYVHMDVRGFTAENGSNIRWIGEDVIGIRQKKNPYALKKPIPDYPFHNAN